MRLLRKRQAGAARQSIPQRANGDPAPFLSYHQARSLGVEPINARYVAYHTPWRPLDRRPRRHCANERAGFYRGPSRVFEDDLKTIDGAPAQEGAREMLSNCRD